MTAFTVNGRPVRYRMPRRDDMVQTGKRHDFLNRWRVGFDNEGKLLGVDMLLAGKCGFSAVIECVARRARLQRHA